MTRPPVPHLPTPERRPALRSGRSRHPGGGPGSLLLAAALVAVALPAPRPVAAQVDPDAGAGDTVTVLDGVFTAAQAEAGEATFLRRCAGCHAPGFFQAETFVKAWAGRPVRSLYRRIRQTMPEDNPGGLKPREYASVIAWILDLNAYPAGERELPSDEEELRRILVVEHPPGG